LFLKPFTRLVCLIVPGVEEEVEAGARYLDERMLKTPAAAIEGAKNELVRMASMARDMISEAVQVFIKNDIKKIKHIEQMEELMDNLEKEINIYLAALSQHSLASRQSVMIGGFMSAANDLERIGDHASNIVHLAEIKADDKLPFSSHALEEIEKIYGKVHSMLVEATAAFESEDKTLARKVIKQDDVVDKMEKNMRKSHIERINTNRCHPSAGVIFLDVISNLERIADHAVNIAQVVVEDF
jgi:phosphate:Na+ symporter